MRVRICWWNTGAAPTQGNANRGEHLADLEAGFELILRRRELDIIVLGEVNSDTLSALSTWSSLAPFSIHDLTVDDLGKRYHMALLYREEVTTVESTRSINLKGSATRKKAGQLVTLKLLDECLVHLLIVHWPSRVLVPAEAHDRPFLARELRSILNQLSEEAADNYTILLGDFNDEPFNDSMVVALESTREIELARDRRHLLYNPFWRVLASAAKTHPVSGQKEPPGTFYYSAGQFNRWYVVDQMLFSSGLLGQGKWRLLEEDDIMWCDPRELGVGPGLSKTIDHVPVFGTLEMRIE